MNQLEVTSDVHNGMHIHLCNSAAKFKTTNLMLMIEVPIINSKTFTANCLIPNLLKAGTAKWPNNRLLSHKLDQLFGGNLVVNSQKKGDKQVISFQLEIIADKYVHMVPTLMEESIQLIHEIIFNPLTENHTFNKELVKQEKSTLKNRMGALNKDKMTYANIRLIQEMFKGESCSIPPLGNEKDFNFLTPTRLFEAYKYLIANGTFDLFVVGDFNPESVQTSIRKTFTGIYKRTAKSFNRLPYKNTLKVYQENQDVEQGKLLMGFQTNSTLCDEDYEAHRLANVIFGRFPSSKIFKRVREEENLAYFALSHLDGHQGILVTMVGVADSSYQRTVDVITQEEAELKAGRFTDIELEQGKALLINLLLEAFDTPIGIMDFYIQSIERQLPVCIQNHIQRIQGITKEDVMNAVKKWELDTIYFLGKGETRRV